MEDEGRLATLSPREREVLGLMSKGLSNSEIGSTLGISANTVKVHAANLLRKLEVTNRTEAVGLFTFGERKGSEPPAIAVLPFYVDSLDPLDRLRADALADDLITLLSRRWFPVIARCSALSVGEGVSRRENIAALRARYLVEGSLHCTGPQLVFNLRVVDGDNQRVLWSEKFSTELLELVRAQQDFAVAIVAAISRATIEHMARSIEHVPVPSLMPWELAARGMFAFWQGSREQHGAAQRFFTAALEQSDAIRLGHFGLALTHQREVIEQWGPSVEEACASLSRVSGRYQALHPRDPWASLMAAYAALYGGRRNDAVQLVSRTLEQEPSSVRGRSLHGQLLAMAGRTAEAVPEIATAIRLSPRAPDRWTLECGMALAYFAGAQYEDAIDWATRSIATKQVSSMPYTVLASSHAHLGQMEEAREALATIKRNHNDYTQRQFGPVLASTDREIAERYLAGLQLAAS